ncbi:MAG: hypothetical protein NZM15_00205 [Flavobacteriales bacterium]|nr:hypothetical protein [Flavobacteriales bacterium]MDW8431108.1 hypothetical protein [Flavobacteriales bacterium]
MSPEKKIKIAGLLAILAAAWFSQGFHHPDEYFQIFELASWKAGLTPSQDLPWEFSCFMRPALQPALVYGVIRATQWAGWFHPFYVMAFFRLFAGVLFFFTAQAVWKAFTPDFSLRKHSVTVLFLALLLWLTPYLAVRFSSENMASCLFFLAILPLREADKKNWGRLFMAGLLLGLVFHLRYQMAFALLGLGLWILIFSRKRVRNLTALMAGGVLTLLAGLVLDAWFYGTWVWTPYNYFYQNIVLKKAAGFGVEPWYFYLRKLTWGQFFFLGPLVLLGYLVMVVRYPRHLVVWTSLPFVLGHHLVGHKEFRFLIPLYLIVPYSIALSFEVLGKFQFLKKAGKFFKRPAVALNTVALCIAALLPPSDNFWFLKNLYELPLKPGTLVVYEEENNYPSPYQDGILKFSFVQNHARPLRFMSFAAWSRLNHPIADSTSCPVFITKVSQEKLVVEMATRHCGPLNRLYQNLYAPLLRMMRDEGFTLPPDVRAYVIYAPAKKTMAGT